MTKNTKSLEFELSYWEITYWPDSGSRKGDFCVRINWERGQVRSNQEERFKTFELAKAWLDAELGND